MAAKLTRLTHKIAIQLHLVAESYTICSSRSRLPVRNLLVTPSYVEVHVGRLNAQILGVITKLNQSQNVSMIFIIGQSCWFLWKSVLYFECCYLQADMLTCSN